jgi:sugar lactone lactonase YvrE
VLSLERKGFKSTLVTLTVLAIAACHQNVPGNLINDNRENFQDLDKEYVFASKALTQEYLKRKLEQWIGPPPNGPNLVKEINYAIFKYPDLFKDTIMATPALFTSINQINEVNTEKSRNPPFRIFLESVDPFPAIPVAVNASNVGGTAFTANWGTASGASEYILTVVNGPNTNIYNVGNVTSYNITGLIQNTTYSYSVKAKNKNGTSASSNIINVTTISISQAGVSTFAGSNTFFQNGPLTLAAFKSPGAVVADSNGNFYIADTGNNVIRKVDSSGNVTTYAGSGNSLNGNGTNASFSSPHGLAIDSAGNLYVTENNTTIRKIDISRNVTTYAGDGGYGNQDGNLTDAQFAGPQGIAIDNTGNLYVTDIYNYNIRKIDPSGNVTTLAGSGEYGDLDGEGTEAQFASPFGITIGTDGNLYVTDKDNYRIRKITASGTVTTFAGNFYGSDDNNGTDASFAQPQGITADNNGNLYVADTGNTRIRKIDSSANVTTIAGNSAGYIDANGTSAAFSNPEGITIDGSGNLYVADTGNTRVNSIRKIDTSGNVSTFTGGLSFKDGTGSTARFYFPKGIITDNNGNFYVADTENYRVRKIDSNGNVTTLGDTNVIFSNPFGLVRDSNGNIYFSEANGSKIRKINTSGNVTIFAGSSQGFNNAQGTNARFAIPLGMAIDSNNNIYVAEGSNHKIRKIDTSGNVTTFAGSSSGFNDAQGTSAQFSSPSGIAIGPDGNFYVADSSNNRIRKIDTSGNVTTVAGTTTSGSTNANGTNAKFSFPVGIAVGNDGVIYVAETGNNRIRKIDTSGNVTTLTGSTSGYADGALTSAKFNVPQALTVASDGNVYVADTVNNRIRKISP